MPDAAPPAPAAPAGPPAARASTLGPPFVRIAVYEVARSDVPPQVGVVVTTALTAELRKLERVSVIGMDEVRAMLDLEAQKQLTGCAADSCLSEIAEALGADIVVTGSLARVGDATFFALKRIEQTTASVAGQFTRKLTAANGEEFLAMIGPAVGELFADRPLRKGQLRGAPGALAARLNPPPLDPWMFWTGVGLGGVSLVATGGAAAVLYDRYQTYVGLIARRSVDGALLNETHGQVRSWEMTAAIAAGLTAVVGIGTGVASGFVDWEGHRAQLARAE